MRVKKIITLFTVTALTLGSLTGCGSKAGTDSKKSQLPHTSYVNGSGKSSKYKKKRSGDEAV